MLRERLRRMACPNSNLFADADQANRWADSDTKLSGAEGRLAIEFAGVFSRETVAEILHDSFDQLDATAKVRTYLELFAERFARERLAAVARSQAGVSGGPPEVLFVCVHNAGRSQMAAGLLDHRAKGTVHVRSAGSAPADSINPAVVEAMAEIGQSGPQISQATDR